MSQTIVGLVQVNNSFSEQSYFPYSVGILQAYAQKNLPNSDRYEFIPPIFNRMRVDEAVEHLMPADIAAFSMYVWNARISLAIARELKRRKPETLIVFGGPHIPNSPSTGLTDLVPRPDRAAEFCRAFPFVDVAVHGEGEKPFVALLNDRHNLAAVPSISYRYDGRIMHTPGVERMRNLDEIPSPYLEGVFDKLIAANPKMEWIAVWETNRGCPFGCTFCDWGSNVNAKIGRWGIERLLAEVDWFAAKKTSYVFCADANFGILPHDLEIARYCVEVRKATGYPSRLSVQNTKSTTRDAMEKSWAVQKVLSDGGLNQGVVVSMQSLHMPTLKAIKRDNMKPEFFREIQRRFTEGGVETMSDLILGMPEETYDSFADGVSNLITGGQHNRIQFNNLSVLPNAEMGDPVYQKKYGMELVTSRIVNIHGSKSEDDEVPEMQELVIATQSMPRPDWVRTRVFAWMTGLLYFDKLLQIPIAFLKESTALSYRQILERFSEPGLSDAAFPEITRVRKFFTDKALEIQAGGEEYCYSKKWLDIWWPADEYVFIRLAVEGKLSAFYEEAERALLSLVSHETSTEVARALQNAVRLNGHLLKKPFQNDDLPLELSSNTWEFHQAAIRGKPIPLSFGPYRYQVNRTSDRWDTWDDWFRRVVWWGNKRGAYLYGNAPVEQLAGHF